MTLISSNVPTGSDSRIVDGNFNSDLSELFSHPLEERLEEHKDHIEALGLSLDENVGDGITTKEFIHFSSRSENIDTISSSKTLFSSEPEENLSLIYALNLGQYIYYGNPTALMGVLSSSSDQGIIFTTPKLSKQWSNMKSESKMAGGAISIEPQEIIDAGEFFRRYGYNEKYAKFFGQTIEAWENA